MKPPLNRDEQIKLMENAMNRQKKFSGKWVSNPTVREVLSRPAEGQTENNSYAESQVQVACCA